MEEILKETIITKDYKKMLKDIECLKRNIEMTFFEFCKNGNLKEAQKIYNDNNFIDINKCHRSMSTNTAIYEACCNGYLEMAKWLYSLGAYIEVDSCIGYEDFGSHCKYTIFTSASRNEENRIDILKWLLSLHESYEYIFVNDLDGLQDACKDGNIEIINLIMTFNEKPSLKILNEGFFNACKYGYLDIAKYMLELGSNPNINISEKNSERYFTERYFNDRKMHYIDIYGTYFDNAFYSANISNHLEIVKWLHSLDNTVIKRVVNEDLIKKICSYHKNVNNIKYLFNFIDKPEINILNKGFYLASRYNNLDIAKYMLELGCNPNDKILNIYEKNMYYHTNNTYLDDAFYSACSEKDGLEIAKWLYSLDNTLIQRIVNDHFIENEICKYHENIEIKKWLLSFFKNK
jgi:ankyrin repeat protein